MDEKIDIVGKHKRREGQKLIAIVCGLILLLLISMQATSMGITDSSIREVVQTIYKGIFKIKNLNTTEKVVLNLRLPRTVLGLLAGVGLSVSGTIMQGITRNPLVSPFTLGISSAAGLGASIAIVFGYSLFGSSYLGIVSNAFIASIICAIIIFLLANRAAMSPQAIILVGIALNYLFQACSTAIQFIADDNKLAKVINWTFGSLNGAEWAQVKIVSIFVLPCLIIMICLSSKFTIVAVMEDELARTVGINPAIIRAIGTIISTLSTAAIISFTGVIGFVGLAAPHIARTIIGNNYKYLIPGSAIIGALLVIVADTIGRLILSPVIIPVGIIISFLGVPVFLHQVALNRRNL